MLKSLGVILLGITIMLFTSTVNAAAVCTDVSVGSLSTGYYGGTVIGQFQQVNFVSDASQGLGDLTIDSSATKVVVELARTGSADRNYNVSIPCPTNTWIDSLGCTNGLLIDPTLTKTKNVAATKTVAAHTVTTFSPFVGKLIISFDSDDDVLLMKLVNLTNLLGTTNMCFGGTDNPTWTSLWYVASPTGNAPLCQTVSDCAAEGFTTPTGWIDRMLGSD